MNVDGVSTFKYYPPLLECNWMQYMECENYHNRKCPQKAERVNQDKCKKLLVPKDAKGQQGQHFSLKFDVLRREQQNEFAKYNNSGGEVYVSN